MKTLNKIPVLDKGHVALYSSSISQEELIDLKRSFAIAKVESMFHMPHVHLHMRCPLFVQLMFASYSLLTLTKRGRQKPEAFMPTAADVGARDLATSEAIAKDIEQTTGALLLNPKAYQMDACDTFISQVISPVSVYNELVVSGSLKQWIEFVQQDQLPGPIEQYRDAIEKVLLAEWNQLDEYIKRKRKN